MLRTITTGESHGQYMAAILEGMPSGLDVDLDFINSELARRQQGYGRGGRQLIEKDRVELVGGVVRQKTTGAPIGFLLRNRDFKIREMPDVFHPRPGHADLAGALKYDQNIRPVLERASARETVMRVAVGALCKLFLCEFDIEIASHVVQIGGVCVPDKEDLAIDDIRKLTKKSSVNCISRKAEKEMMKAIDAARRQGDTCGGKFEVRVSGVPIGLGSYVHFERKLDGRLAQVLMSLQTVKAVEIGRGTELAGLSGSAAHDEIFHDKKRGFYHKTNRAGGLEGGVTNGADLIVRATMKPISTLGQPLMSVNMKTRVAEQAHYERSDICAVPAGSVIGESLVATVITDAMLEKFGGDSLGEIVRNYEGYLTQIYE
ncbi:MAG: chorismate synthase [Candidatus Omnitrophica bacterium]|nr:chorismate synthase [Candidatus Omnitrophota bacterium]MDD5670382.1 chorismate synthase [Candidatus Omnitrophota bacterium]